jgi:hypothetical protein
MARMLFEWNATFHQCGISKCENRMQAMLLQVQYERLMKDQSNGRSVRPQNEKPLAASEFELSETPIVTKWYLV